MERLRPFRDLPQESTDSVVLRASGIAKSFIGSRALCGVDFELRRGEIHGLVGHNGSGKSTFVKILAGVHAPDDGRLEIWDRQVALPLHSASCLRLGLCFVHQDLGLVPDMTVLENLRMGEFARRRRLSHISWANERRRAEEQFRRFGLTLDLARYVRELPMSERAFLAIVRALEDLRASEASVGEGRAILVLDEATVSLPEAEKTILFDVLRRVVSRGDSVVFISHYLDDVVDVADRVTVFRDGLVVACRETSQIQQGELVRAITGKATETHIQAIPKPRMTFAAGDGAPREEKTSSEVFEVSEASGAGIDSVSFEVRSGEILGLTGLVGSGYEELPELLFGARRADSGAMSLDGHRHDLHRISPRRAVELGISYVPSNRTRDGVILALEAWENLALLSLSERFVHLRLNRRRLVNDARAIMVQYDIRPVAPQLRMCDFSGGNQQKMLLAKWIEAKPRLLLLNEPTAGVDVGARVYIFQLLRAVAGAGVKIICATGDQKEVADLCHRALIFGRGRITSQLVAAELTKESLVEKCYAGAGKTTPISNPRARESDGW